MTWIVLSDFNDVLDNSEKFGGLKVSYRRASLFRDCLNDCNLIDLGFKGPRFIWTNKRQSGLIMERLDRVFINSE